MKLKVGQIAPNFLTKDVLGSQIELHQFKGKKIYISLLRNTRCPMCSLFLYRLSKKATELIEKGLEIIVFYESHEKMFFYSDYFQNLVLRPKLFPIVSDTERKVYSLYKAEVLPTEVANERFLKANRMAQFAQIQQLGITGDGIEEGTHQGAVPADFLIDENLIIQHAH
ncbi:MAG: hypothetical protein OHK0053_14090 [Microscillaceae bacterium]